MFPPLVRSPCLQDALVLTEQLQVVVGLQQLIAEFRVADPILRQPRCNGFPIEHSVDAEVLPHVSQELQGTQVVGPVEVIHHDGGVRTVEVVEAL